MSSSWEPREAPERLQLHRRVSILDLTGSGSSEGEDEHPPPLPPPPPPKSQVGRPTSQNPVPNVENSTRNPTPSPDSAELVADLRDEIEALEDALERVAAEKHALKMRLNEIEFVQKFQVGHCKRWLAANFDFDRKDSPDLLAGIFEDYLLQNDSLEPLPHQMIIKNSSRARARRDKLVQQRSQHQHLRGLKRDAKPAVDLPPLKKATASAHRVPDNSIGDSRTNNSNGTESNNISSTSTNTTNSTSSNGNGSSGSFWDIYNVFIPVDEMERVFALEPWRSIPADWPQIVTTSRTGPVTELIKAQETFLKDNALAIWERSHWFPIKQQNGRTEDEIKRLATLYNRRKRRQTMFKTSLEQLARLMQKKVVERSVLRQSIFCTEAVDMLLRRPRLWIPREGEDLVAQLEEIDRLEPDRLQYV